MANIVTDNFAGVGGADFGLHIPDTGTAPALQFLTAAKAFMTGNGGVQFGQAAQGTYVYPDVAAGADQVSRAILTPYGQVGDLVISILCCVDSTGGGGGGATYYEWRFAFDTNNTFLTGAWQLLSWNNGSFTVLSNVAAVLEFGKTYQMELSAIGSGGSRKVTAKATGQADVVVTNNTLPGGVLQRSSGLSFFATKGPYNIFFEKFTFDDATTGIAVAPYGEIIQVANTPTLLRLQALYDGTFLPVAAEWRYSTTVNFSHASGTLISNGSGVSNATTPIIDITPTALAAILTSTTVPTYFSCKLTDASANTITTKHRAGYLAGTTLFLFEIGDSTTAEQVYSNRGRPPGYYIARMLASMYGITVNRINAAVSGLGAVDWFDAAGVGATARLQAALASAGGSWTGYYVIVRLGVNDAANGVTNAVYLANMTGLVNYIVSNGGKVVLCDPLPREPGIFAEATGTTFDEATNPLEIQYLASLRTLINGTTIIAGDQSSFRAFWQDPSKFNSLPNAPNLTSGRIHEDDTGAAEMGFATAIPIAVNAGLISSGGGGTNTVVGALHISI